MDTAATYSEVMGIFPGVTGFINTVVPCNWGDREAHTGCSGANLDHWLFQGLLVSRGVFCQGADMSSQLGRKDSISFLQRFTKCNNQTWLIFKACKNLHAECIVILLFCPLPPMHKRAFHLRTRKFDWVFYEWGQGILQNTPGTQYISP